MEGPVRELRENAIGATLVDVKFDPETYWVVLVFDNGARWPIKLEAATTIRWTES